MNALCLPLVLETEKNSKTNGAIHLKLEHIVVNGNSSDEFDNMHCLIKFKVTASL